MGESSSAAMLPADEPPKRPQAVRFGIFELDFDSAELRKRGLRVRFQEQPFRVLSLLLEQPGRVVSREELQSRLWPGDTFVDFDHGLNTAINKIRQALGDSASNPRFIETMHRRGYRFIAPVEEIVAVADAADTATPPVETAPSPAGTARVHTPAARAETPAAPVEKTPVAASPPPPADDFRSPAAESQAHPFPWQPESRPVPGLTIDPSVRRWFKAGGAIVFSLTIAFAVIAVSLLFNAARERLSRTFDSQPDRIAPAVVNQVRILAAQSSDYLSPAEKHWSADRYFVGGETTRRTGVVVGAGDTNLFLGERYGRFKYVIPAMPRTYRLTLHFAETWFGGGNPGDGGPGSRVFDVDCNGTYLLRSFDLFREAGGANRAITRNFDGIRPNEQGNIVITFLPRANNAMINALELTPMEMGTPGVPEVPRVPGERPEQ